MKHVLLTSLSLLLLSSSAAQAQDREHAAGQATPVKLGGDDRSKALSKPAAAVTQQQSGANAGAAAAGGQTASGSATAGSPPAAAKKALPFGHWRSHLNKPGAAPIKGFGPPGVTQTVGSGQLPAGFSEPGTKTAFGGKGLIPPPPATMQLGPAKLPAASKKAKAKAAPAASEKKLITVGSGSYHLLGHQAKEEFVGPFDWQPDTAGDTLTFKAKFTPIGTGNPHFNWIRLMLGNQILADERALAKKSEYTIDLTGKVDKGVNQIIVDGQGSAGAAFEWKITTPKKCKLSSLDPDEVVVGTDLKLKGEGFDPNPAKDIVTIGPKSLIPTTATDKELKVRIPKEFQPGEYKVKVTVDGLASHELKVTIRGIPELTGTNFNGIPPGATLVIYGKNFSKKTADNKVTFDGTPAQVISSTENQLTVIVPNFSNEDASGAGNTAHISGQVGIPIRVKVGKVDAINTVPINVGNSMWQDPGLKGGPDAPQVPVDWRRLLE